MKRKITLLLAGLMAVSSFSMTACGGRESQVEIDTSKSVLHVGVFNAGYGSAWGYEAAADFEKLYENTSFEEGKKGVQVIIEAEKEAFTTTALTSTMAGKKNALYYLSNFQYDNAQATGLIADISEIYQEKVYDENGDLAMMDDGKGNLIPIGNKTATLSMRDRATPEAKDLWLEEDQKYYGAPWAGLVTQLVYDADLFDRYRYFSDAQGNFNKTLADVESGNCGTGPDGKMGTADDGMPVTYNDFLRLMKKMKEEDVIPFTWSGDTTYQRQQAFRNVFANYEGAERFDLNYNKNVSQEEMAAAGVSNVYEYLALQEGRKAAVQFFHDIVKGGYYDPQAFTQSYTAAQSNYINSVNDEKPIAFFMEGSYWESETRKSFDEMAKDDASLGYGKRNFKVLPVPNFVGVEGLTDEKDDAKEQVFCGSGTTALAFLTEKNSCDNPALERHLAELFLQFTSSREQLVKIMKNTGGCIGLYDFEIYDDELTTLTKYGQDICRYLDEGTKIVWSTEHHEDKANTLTAFFLRYNGTHYYDCASMFKNNPEKTVAECHRMTQDAVKSLIN